MSGKGKGISDVKIKRMIENSSNDDLKADFVGVFVSNEIIYLISSHSLLKNKHKISLLDLKPRQSRQTCNSLLEHSLSQNRNIFV